jgi:hypothetical protein
LGQWIGRWWSVLGIDGLAFPISGTLIVMESGRTKKPTGSICLAQQWLLSDEGATNGKRIEPIERLGCINCLNCGRVLAGSIVFNADRRMAPQIPRSETSFRISHRNC